VIETLGLDELPQVWNVIRGEMSFVGPRAISEADFDLLDDWQKRRYLVRPGITGLWQIAGREDTAFADMIRLDLFYVQRWSIFLDVEILLKTISASLYGRRSTLHIEERPSSLARTDFISAFGRVDRRVSFGSQALKALLVPTTFDELASLAGHAAEDADALIHWLGQLSTNGWLGCCDSSPADGVGSTRFRLTRRAMAHLASDPRRV
jgi:hypothetical protein